MRWVKLPLTLEVHRTLSLIGLVAIASHGWVLLFDREFGFGFAEVLVPLSSPYRPIAVGAGVTAAYLAIVISGSFYVRRWLGQRAWRLMHYGTFATFFLAMVHGLWAGTDSGSVGGVLLYGGTGALVLFLTYTRVLGGRYVPKRQPAAQRRSAIAPIAREPFAPLRSAISQEAYGTLSLSGIPHLTTTHNDMA
jgi:hypothetical protein